MIERLMREHLAGVRASSILEVGPGYSKFGRVAADVTGAKKLVLVDVDPAVLDWQRSECEKIGLSVDCQLLSLDVDDLDRITGSYDLILCQEVLEHLTNAEEVLPALATRLAPGGTVIITVPTRFSERLMKRLNPSYMEGQLHGHVREFDQRELMRVIENAGLQPIVFVGTQPHYFISHVWMHATRMKVEMATGSLHTSGVRFFIWGRLTHYLRRLFLFTGPEKWGRLFARNYFVVARKGDGSAVAPLPRATIHD